MRRLRVLTLLAAFSVASFALGAGARATMAVFTDPQTTNPSSYTTIGCFADDPAAPTIPSTVIGKTTPYLAGSLRAGMAYYVYANATAGSGGAVERVIADVRSLTAGEFLVPLKAGSYTAGGVAYDYRSAALTAASPLTEGGYSYSVSAGDVSLNCRTATSSVMIDHTPPTGTDVQPNNGSGTSGRPDQGDTIVYTFSETIEPESVSSGWTGGSRNVVVRIADNGNNDLVTVWDATNTVQLPLGTTDLTNNYVSTNTTFGVSGTPSTMVQSGTSISVTLGTQAGTTRTVNPASVASWTPSAAATDAAGNGCSTAVVTESGSNDRNF